MSQKLYHLQLDLPFCSMAASKQVDPFLFFYMNACYWLIKKVTMFIYFSDFAQLKPSTSLIYSVLCQWSLLNVAQWAFNFAHAPSFMGF